MTVQRKQSVPVLNEVRPSARDGSSLMRAVLNLNQHCAALSRYLFELESRAQVLEATVEDLSGLKLWSYVDVSTDGSGNRTINASYNIDDVVFVTNGLGIRYDTDHESDSFPCHVQVFGTIGNVSAGISAQSADDTLVYFRRHDTNSTFDPASIPVRLIMTTWETP